MFKTQENTPGKIIDIVIVLIVVNIFGLAVGVFSDLWQGLLTALFSNVNNQQLIFLFVASLFQALLFIGLTLFFIFYRKQGNLREWGFTAGNLPANLRLGIIGGAGLFSLVVGTGIVVNYFFPVDPEPQPFARLIMDITDTRQLILPLLMGSVLAPLGEEIFFRGFVYPIFRRRFGVLAAIVLSSMVFASLHFDLIRMLPIAVGGMGLAWLFERSGSLITPVVAHSVWNTIMTLMIISVGIT